MPRNLMRRVAVTALVVPLPTGPPAARAVPASDGGIGTVPLVVLIVAALWVAGMTFVIAFRRRRSQDADDR